MVAFIAPGSGQAPQEREAAADRNTLPSGGKVNTTEALRFLRRVWFYTSSLADTFVIVVIKDGKVIPAKASLSELGDYGRLFSAVEKLLERERLVIEGAHVYFQVLPLSRKPEKGRGTAKDVKVGKWLWCDLDYKEVVEKPEFEGVREGEDHSLEAYYEEGGKWIHVKRPPLSEVLKSVREKLGIGPTLVVDSGAGYHLYFQLDSEVEASRLQQVEAKLVEALGGDPQSKDLARILRLPGSINPRVNRLCRVIFESDSVVNIEELSQRLEQLLKKREEKPKAIEEPREEKLQAKPQLRELDEAKLSRICELLKEAYRPGVRQDIAFSLAGWFLKRGVSPLSAARIIKYLHAVTRDEEPLGVRLSAIIYTYKKAGVDLEPYRRAIEELAGGEQVWGFDFSKTAEKIKGVSGLQEALEESVGEERALAILAELEEILEVASPFRDSIFELLDYERQLYAVANPRRGIMARAKRVEGKMVYKERVAVVCPTRVVVYTSPLGGLTKYEITFEGATLRKPLTVGPAYIEEIAERLKAEGLVYHSRLIHDTLNAVVQAFVKKGKAELKEEVESPGFYMFDGRLVGVKVELKDVDVKRLEEALLVLNELAMEWFSHAQDKFATVVKWGIAAPFTYIMKAKNNIMQKYLYLYGDTNTGKTTLGKIVLRMWGLDSRWEKTGASIDTPARLGYVLSMGTFPVLINEPGGALEREDIKEMLKNAADSLTARGKYERGTYREYPALAPLIFTSNKYLPKDDALIRRMIIITFSYGEKIPPERQDEFKSRVEPKLPLLSEIGRAVARLVEEHPELVFNAKDAIALGELLLEKCFMIAGLPTPPWLKLRYEEVEDVAANILDDFKERLLALINKLYAQTVARGETTIEEKLAALLRTRAIPGMKLSKDNRRVVIKRQLLDELGLSINLKSLAEILGGEYNGKYTEKEDGMVKGCAAVICDYEKILGLLLGE